MAGVGWVLNPLLAAVVTRSSRSKCVIIVDQHTVLIKITLPKPNTIFLPASALEPWEYQTCATPNPIHFILLFMDVGEK